MCHADVADQMTSISDILPFSRDEFFAVFVAYNDAIWPAQIAAYLLGSVAVVLALSPWLRRPNPAANGTTVLVLALMWGWTGIAYHWIYFGTINPAAIAFGALFLTEAVLLAHAGLVQRCVEFGSTSRRDTVVGALLIAYALGVYPLVGYWADHIYPAAPMFGVTPCPVTIFTFGLLLLSKGRISWTLYAIPVAWSLIGGSAALLLDIPQDWMLPLSGIVGVTLIAQRARSET